MEAASRDLIANCPESRDPVPGADFSTPLSAPPPSSSFIYHLVRRSSSRPFPLQPAHYELLTISISCASRVATVIVANKTRAIAPRSRIVMQTCSESCLGISDVSENVESGFHSGFAGRRLLVRRSNSFLAPQPSPPLVVHFNKLLRTQKGVQTRSTRRTLAIINRGA